MTTAAVLSARARSASTSAGAAPGAIHWVDLGQCEDSDLRTDLSFDAAYAHLHARWPDGRLVSGAPAFAALWQALPAFRLAGRVAALPGVVQGLEWGYRGFLNVRRLWLGDAAASRSRTAPRKTESGLA